jgi:hypothetical protein
MILSSWSAFASGASNSVMESCVAFAAAAAAPVATCWWWRGRVDPLNSGRASGSDLAGVDSLRAPLGSRRALTKHRPTRTSGDEGCPDRTQGYSSFDHRRQVALC